MGTPVAVNPRKARPVRAAQHPAIQTFAGDPMKIDKTFLLAVLCAAGVFGALNAVTLSVADASVHSYFESVGKYVHAL